MTKRICLFLIVFSCVTAHAVTLPDAPSHAFVSRANVTLWTLDATSKGLDGYVTARSLSAGAVEQDPIARPFTHGAASQAAYFGISFAGDIAFSYLMHRTGHHRVERIGMLIMAGQSFICAGRSMAAYRTYP